MESIADALAALPVLRDVPPRQLRTTAALWESLALAPGEVLWTVGHPVDSLAVLLEGELVAELDGTVVGRVRAGDLVGEAAGFFVHATRSATLRACVSCRVLVLSAASLRTLRWQGSGVYDALLEQGLLSVARRVGAIHARIARVSVGGVAAPARTELSARVRLWKALRPGGPSGPCPPVEPLLRRLPGLADAAPGILAALARGLVAEPVEEGRILFLEGEPGAAAWLVADGAIDVLRHVGSDRAERLATLGPGGLVGLDTLVEPGPRTASCVAVRAGWLYRMDAQAYAGQLGDHRVAWRESLLVSLAAQIRDANAALRRASAGVPAPTG